MLAKWWKKIALAICIIAILFNVTYKLVHRTNIKEQLTSVLDGEAISFFQKDDQEVIDEGDTNQK
jgi:hypothetical protein